MKFRNKRNFKHLCYIPLMSIIVTPVLFASISCSNQKNLNYLWISAEKQASVSFACAGGLEKTFPNLQVSDDYGLTWYDVDFSQQYIGFTIRAGKALAFKGNNPNGFNNGNNYITIRINNSGSSSTINNVLLEGNLSSLINNGSGEEVEIKSENCFRNLFTGSCITDASKLVLPSKLNNGCYEYMFYGCTSLTAIPQLPNVSTLPDNCYGHMFENCTSLKIKEDDSNNSTKFLDLTNVTISESSVSDMFLATSGTYILNPRINHIYYYYL